VSRQVPSGPLAVAPQDALAVRPEAHDRRLRAVVEMIGLQPRAPYAQFFEGMSEQKQFRLGVDGGSPVSTPVPGTADLKPLVRHVDGLAARPVDDRERNRLAPLRVPLTNVS
jgi:hypothetical protein